MDTLETERLIIRPFVMDDLEDAHQLLDGDLIWAGPGFTLEQRRERLQFYIHLASWGDTDQLYGYRAVTLKENDTLLGICGFMPAIWKPQEREIFGFEFFGESLDSPTCRHATHELSIGYAIGSPFQGRGYATESAQALIGYAFNILKVRRIIATTDRMNLLSIKLMKRIGMRTAVNHRANWPGVVGILDNDTPDL